MKTVFDLSNWDYNNKSINSLCSCVRNVEEESENAVKIDVTLMVISDTNNRILKNAQGEYYSTKEVEPHKGLEGYFLLCANVKMLLQKSLKLDFVGKLLPKSQLIPVRIHHHQEKGRIEVIFHFVIQDNLFGDMSVIGDIVSYDEIKANHNTKDKNCTNIYLDSLKMGA